MAIPIIPSPEDASGKPRLERLLRGRNGPIIWTFTLSDNKGDGFLTQNVTPSYEY